MSQSLFLIRLYGQQFFIKAQGLQSTDGALDTVQILRRAKFHSPHIHDVGNIMLITGGGSGATGIIHGHAADHQALEHRLHRILFPPQQAIRPVNALLQGRADQLGHFLAVIFAGDDVRHAPFANADIFCDHIAQTGPQQAHGSLAQNIRVADDHIRGFGVDGYFQAGAGHGGSSGSIAIHGRGSAYDHIRQPGQGGQHFADVIDHAASHGNDCITVLLHVHHGAAHPVFIRMGLPGLQGERLERDCGIRKQLADLLPRRRIGI